MCSGIRACVFPFVLVCRIKRKRKCRTHSESLEAFGPLMWSATSLWSTTSSSFTSTHIHRLLIFSVKKPGSCAPRLPLGAAGCLLITQVLVKAPHAVFLTSRTTGTAHSKRPLRVLAFHWLKWSKLPHAIKSPLVFCYSSTECHPDQRHSETGAADIPTFLSGERADWHGQEPGNGHPLYQFR